jgi:acyl-CoA reductase-like NAD-dependent aldehyde dehydrogenase
VALLVGRLPGTTSALQTLPDSTLLALTATSVGLGAGFYLARAPRLVVAAGILPALAAGAAIVLRPISPPPSRKDDLA